MTGASDKSKDQRIQLSPVEKNELYYLCANEIL